MKDNMHFVLDQRLTTKYYESMGFGSHPINIYYGT